MRRLSIVAAAILAVAACHRKPSVPPDVIARVGERMVTLADFNRYLDRNTGTDLAQMGPEVASAITDQYLEEVILSEYAAAHGVSPFGARGENSGVQDADNLAWKLAAVLQHEAPDALLDSYASERE